MIIIVAAISAPTEQQIQTEMAALRTNPPPGLIVDNPEMLREYAVNEILRQQKTPTPETRIVPGPAPQTPEAKPLSEEERQRQLELLLQDPSMSEVPSPKGPKQEYKKVELDPAVEARAQELLAAYKAVKPEDPQAAQKKDDIINQVLALRLSAGVTVREWLESYLRKFEDKEPPFPQTPSTAYDWVYKALNSKAINKLLPALKVMRKLFFQRGLSSLAHFGKYFDKFGNLNEDMIPPHLRDKERIFSRLKYDPIGYRGDRYIADVLNMFKNFKEVEDYSRKGVAEARLIKEYVEDMMVSDAYRWKNWEAGGKYRPSQPYVIPGNKGSQTYAAIENLNRVYGILANMENLPKMAIEPVEWLEPDPSDPNKAVKNLSFRTKRKPDTVKMGLMLKEIKKKFGNKQLEANINSTLPEGQKISLEQQDYLPGGRFYVGPEMLETPAADISPTAVWEARTYDPVRFQSTELEGEEGETYEVGQEEVRHGTESMAQPVEKPDLAEMFRSPGHILISPAGEEIVKNLHKEVETEEKTIEKDPTQDVYKMVRRRARELFEGLKQSPPPPQGVLVYPLFATMAMQKRKLSAPTRQDAVRFLTEITKTESLEQALASIKDSAEAGAEELLKYKVPFSANLVGSNYLYLRPLNEKADQAMALKGASHGISQVTSGQLVDIYTPRDKEVVSTSTPLAGLENYVDRFGKKHQRKALINEYLKEMYRGFVTHKVEDEWRRSKGSPSPTTPGVPSQPITYSTEMYSMINREYEEMLHEQATRFAQEEIFDVLKGREQEITTEDPMKQLERKEEIERKRRELERIKPTEKIKEDIENLYKMRDKSPELKSLTNPQERKALFTRIIESQYPQPPRFPEDEEKWARGEPERAGMLKSYLAHQLIPVMGVRSKTDPIENIVTNVWSIPQFREFLSTEREILTEAEMAANAGVREKVYKLINGIIGEVIASLLKPKSKLASMGSAAELLDMVNELRLVKIAVMARMLVKVG